MNWRDPYYFSDADVLRNNADIRDSAQLAQFEYRKTAERSLELAEQPVQGSFDLKHLQAIHKHLFQDVYDWAGELRTVNISKGSSHFARVEQLESYANSTVFKNLAKDNFLQGMEKDRFVERLADHYGEINALHPFREGNGRSTRQFIEQLAQHAGYELDYTKVDRQRWNDAARESFNGRTEAMATVFADIARPEKALSFERDKPEVATKKYPDLVNAFATLRAADVLAQERFANPNDQQKFVAMTRETLTRNLEQNKPIPTVTVKELAGEPVIER